VAAIAARILRLRSEGRPDVRPDFVEYFIFSRTRILRGTETFTASRSSLVHHPRKPLFMSEGLAGKMLCIFRDSYGGRVGRALDAASWAA